MTEARGNPTRVLAHPINLTLRLLVNCQGPTTLFVLCADVLPTIISLNTFVCFSGIIMIWLFSDAKIVDIGTIRELALLSYLLPDALFKGVGCATKVSVGYLFLHTGVQERLALKFVSWV